MSKLKPIPLDLVPFPVRSDFTEEAGILVALRAHLKPNQHGKILPATKAVLPPNHTAPDYHRIAQWAELPDRVAYFYVSPFKGLKPRLAILVTPEFTIHAPLNHLTNQLLSEAQDFLVGCGDPHWSFDGVKSPGNVLLHDRTSNSVVLMPRADVGNYLSGSLKWKVPG